VELIGERIDDEDKSCAYARRVIGWADASEMIRLWACWCVRQVWNVVTDERSRDAVRVSERFARGEATRKELRAAGLAADETWVEISNPIGRPLVDIFGPSGKAVMAAASAAYFATMEHYLSLVVDTSIKASEAAAYAASINAEDRDAAWSEAWKFSRKAQSEELERRAMELLGITNKEER
jgi:hypothetical protein